MTCLTRIPALIFLALISAQMASNAFADVVIVKSSDADPYRQAESALRIGYRPPIAKFEAFSSRIWLKAVSAPPFRRPTPLLPSHTRGGLAAQPASEGSSWIIAWSPMPTRRAY